jgi:plasmid maintenance system killer protein
MQFAINMSDFAQRSTTRVYFAKLEKPAIRRLCMLSATATVEA